MSDHPSFVVLDPVEAVGQLRLCSLDQVTGVLVQRSGTLALPAGSVVPLPGGAAEVLLTLPRRWAPGQDERLLVVELDGPAGRLACEVVERTSTGRLMLFVCKVIEALATGPSFSQLSTRRGFDLADDAYRRARDLVLLRQYPPDSTLEVDELTFDLGAAEAAVAFALARLELDGLVRRDPDRGYVVVPFDAQSSDEVFDARCAIEIGVLETALAAVRSERISELRAVFELMSGQLEGGHGGDVERSLDVGIDFHQQIVMLSDNEALRTSYLRLGVRATMTRTIGSTGSTSQRFIEVQRALLDGIEARDVTAARAAALAYRDLAKAQARAILGQTGGWL